MKTENSLQIKPSLFNTGNRIPHNCEQQLFYPEFRINTNRNYMLENVYNQKGDKIDYQRITNDVRSWHPSQRIPIVNPEYKGSW
jgi:hypothetical protein